MAKNYTENDLLLYLYNELDENEVENLEIELLSNSHLQLALMNLKAGMAVLDELSVEPDPTSVEIILEYSSQTAKKTLEEV